MLLKRGRPSHAVWKYYNDSGECSHCGYSSHCRKAERAVQHLRNCVNFQLQVHSGAASLPTFLNNTVHERNSSSNDVLPPPLKKDELKCFQELFVQGLYEAGAPFTLLEQPAIKEATKLLRPNASLPTRQTAASTFLETNYAKRKEEIYQEMRENTETLTLQADGAKGNDNYPYIHHCITSPTQGYLLESKNCGSESKNAQFLAQEFTRIYESLPLDVQGRVKGFVTDNCSANVSCWNIVHNRHPSIITVGCACHALHLLCQDITEEAHIRRQFPFRGQPLQETMSVVKDIVYILKTEKFNYELSNLLKQNNKRSLCKPVSTRWGYTYYCVSFFKEALDLLFPFINRFLEGVNSQVKAHRILLQQHFLDPQKYSSFRQNLDLYISVTKPIVIGLRKLEKSTSTLSDVIITFKNISEQFTNITMGNNNLFNMNEFKQFLLMSLRFRFTFIIKNEHKHALLLDPRVTMEEFRNFLGPQEIILIETSFVTLYSRNDATRSSRIKEQLLALQEDKLLMQEYGDLLYLAMKNQDNPTHPLKYWERKRETWPELYEVATVLLAVTPVTAFTERSFSMTKRTMRAERSSLREVSASKLSFLKVNARSIKKRRVNQEEMEQVYETPYETSGFEEEDEDNYNAEFNEND